MSEDSIQKKCFSVQYKYQLFYYKAYQLYFLVLFRRCTQIEQSHNELSELNEKLKKQNAELEQQNREAVSIEFEFKRLQGE